MIADAINAYDTKVGKRLETIEDLLVELRGMGRLIKWGVVGLIGLGSGMYGWVRIFHP